MYKPLGKKKTREKTTYKKCQQYWKIENRLSVIISPNRAIKA